MGIFPFCLSIHKLFHKDPYRRCIRYCEIVDCHVENVVILCGYIHRIDMAKNRHILNDSNRTEYHASIANCHLYNIVCVRCKALNDFMQVHFHSVLQSVPFRYCFICPISLGYGFIIPRLFLFVKDFFCILRFAQKVVPAFMHLYQQTSKNPYISTLFKSFIYIIHYIDNMGILYTLHRIFQQC